MLNITGITCPDDCTDVSLLPAIVNEQDCTGYTQTLSQVCDLYIIPSAASDIFSDWDDPEAIASVNDTVDNTQSDNSTAHWLVGIGGVAEAEETVTEYPKLQRKVTERLYTLTFRVLNLVQAQYELIRMLQCGDTSFKFYYADLGGYVYGVLGGISPNSVDADFPHGAGNTDKNVGIITITFRANGDPDRRVMPTPAPQNATA